MDTMRNRFVAFSVLLWATPLFADVTVRYNTDFKMSPSLPAAAVNQFGKAGLGEFAPSVIRIKGDKAYTSMGKYSLVTDFATNQLTYIDSANMRYATVPVEEFGSKLAGSMPQLPPQAAGLAEMFKTEIQSRKTGQTATIRGLSAYEYEVVVALNVSLPALPTGSGPAVRVVLHIWRADTEEIVSNPALSEFMRFSDRSKSFMNATNFLSNLAGPLQSLGQSAKTIQEELTKQNSPVLRVQMEETSPMLAALLPQAQTAGQPLPANFDPAAPLVSFNQEMVEFSTTPVEDSVFQAPAGFSKVTLEEILKDQFAAITR
jgi:hypothetical protein